MIRLIQLLNANYFFFIPMIIDIEVGCEQAGFRKNSGTREAHFCLKVITEKYLEMGKELCACFIDYSKAFDTVNHKKNQQFAVRNRGG